MNGILTIAIMKDMNASLASYGITPTSKIMMLGDRGPIQETKEQLQIKELDLLLVEAKQMNDGEMPNLVKQEMLLQLLLKVDKYASDDDGVRTKRKEVVKVVNGYLESLDRL